MDADDQDDNQNLIGSKLIVTWSESIRSDGLTIFENEAVIKFSPLAFYSKIGIAPLESYGTIKFRPIHFLIFLA